MSPLAIAEVRAALAFLGESTATELYGTRAVQIAKHARPGLPVTALWNALRRCNERNG